MNTENQSYQFDILEHAVNQCLDKLLPCDNEDALNVIANQSSDLVWRIATDIYKESGHQIDFAFIKNILNLRIEPLRNKITEEERTRKNKKAEEAIIRANLEAEKLAKIAEQERIEKEQKEEEQKKLQQFKEANPNIDMDYYKEVDTFMRIKNIIVEYFEIGEERITSNAILNKDLGIGIIRFSWDSSSSNDGDLEGVEFIMSIEEEFNIEILDKESESLLSGNISQLVNFILPKI